MKKTIAIYSTRGGTGKTMTSMLIARDLALRGKKVVVIDGDLEAPSIRHLFPSEKKLADDEYWVHYLDKENSEIKKTIQKSPMENISLIYSSPPEIGRKFLRSKKKSWWATALRRSIKAQEILYDEGYDYIILDNQSGTSFNSVNNMVIADVSVLVMRPTNYGVNATYSFVSSVYKILKGFKERKDFYLWNQVIPGDTPEEKEILKNFLNANSYDLDKIGLEYGSIVFFSKRLNFKLMSPDPSILKNLSGGIIKSYETIVNKILTHFDDKQP